MLRRILLLAIASPCVMALLHANNIAFAQTATVNDQVSINQEDLLNGEIAFRKIIESGRHLFSTPFLPQDGHGEGGAPDPNDPSQTLPGPRKALFEANLSRLANDLGVNVEDIREHFNYSLDPVRPDGTSEQQVAFLRLNGLDSQSCFECHNTIGSDSHSDTLSAALSRKPSANGGPAGVASNAFINDDLPYRAFTFIRNPPHVFGTGYAQKLAEEMTLELLYQRATLIGRAVLEPNEFKEEELTAKGISFGVYRVKYSPASTGAANARTANRTLASQNGLRFVDAEGNLKLPEFADGQYGALIDGDFEHDFSQLEGIGPDLVVRPFQWKGIASDERNFVRDALRFHFGVMPVEIESVEDEDQDGVYSEMSVGNVSALTIFTTMLRPPTQIQPTVTIGDLNPIDSTESNPVYIHSEVEAAEVTTQLRQRVEEGRLLFSGESQVPFDRSCASCHKPSMTTIGSTLVVRDPAVDEATSTLAKTGLSSKRRSSSDLPIYRRFNKVRPRLRLDNSGNLRMQNDEESQLRQLVERSAMREADDQQADGYAYDLTLKTTVSLPLSYPRLPENANGDIEVPLFSDFKRHKMGSNLADIQAQETDVKGVFVPADEFLTRPLWGVADTGPWLHDGRARTLRQAILLHRGEGSEANLAIDSFEALDQDDQQKIVEFLLTLRLGVEGRYSFENKP